MSGLKQEIAFKEVLKGSTISKAMLTAGYSKTTATTTGKLTNTKKWQELVARHISDNKIAKLHDKLLNKEEVISLSDGAQNGAHLEWTGQPHSDAVKALEMAYRLKDKYPRDGEGGGNKVLVINISGETSNRYVAHESTSDDSK